MLCLYTQLYLSQVCTEFRPQVIQRMSKNKRGFGHAKRDIVVLQVPITLMDIDDILNQWPGPSDISPPVQMGEEQSVRVTQALKRNDKNTTTSIKAQQTTTLMHTYQSLGQEQHDSLSEHTKLHTQYNAPQKRRSNRETLSDSLVCWLVFFKSDPYSDKWLLLSKCKSSWIAAKELKVWHTLNNLTTCISKCLYNLSESDPSFV